MQAAIIGIGRWGKRILNYLPAYFSVRMQADSRSDLDIIWRHRSIEAVVIATPVATHYRLARKALEAGKHVFCEKPLTTTIAEAEELRRISAEKGLTLVTDYIVTFSPYLQDLAAKCQDADYFFSLRWRLDPRPGLDVAHTLLSHDLAMLDMFHQLDDIVFSGIDVGRREVAILGSTKRVGSDFRCLLTASLDIPQKETMLSVRAGDDIYRYPLDDKVDSNLLDAALKYFRRCIAGDAKPNVERSIRVTGALGRIAHRAH